MRKEVKGCDVGAGTGKSLLLKHILRALPQATTYLTASTGLAASVLGGTTLNAFAGGYQPDRWQPLSLPQCSPMLLCLANLGEVT